MKSWTWPGAPPPSRIRRTNTTPHPTQQHHKHNLWWYDSRHPPLTCHSLQCANPPPEVHHWNSNPLEESNMDSERSCTRALRHALNALGSCLPCSLGTITTIISYNGPECRGNSSAQMAPTPLLITLDDQPTFLGPGALVLDCGQSEDTRTPKSSKFCTCVNQNISGAIDM